MSKRTAVITGASSGFGMLTSLELAKRGFDVIATVRNEAKGVPLQKQAAALGIQENIAIFQLDVTAESSIQSLERRLNKIERVDLLINNAGYAAGGFVEEVSLGAYRQQFETNVFGAIAVTKTVLPIMRKQRSGTIINMSSISGRMGFPGLSPYAASKHALEGWSESLRLEVQPFGIHVVLVEPGSYKTNIWSTGKQIAKASLDPSSPYHTYMTNIEAYLKRGQDAYGDPDEVAKKIADIAEQQHPTFRHPIGKGVKLSIALKSLLSWERWEQLVLKRLNK
ncbi:NAD(P)-dependent dehydrogenase (short-subunit alcohol dehydrogenase family) [Bacillus fengqiuensis]|nr:NAD(P)-dependent dehydrogenase (short-subunit alcohol dehydrogenase family) [Bacillus fengqiuensis]